MAEPMKNAMKEKILRETAKIIAKDGLAGASIRTVCKASGVQAPTVYYYFKDKDSLIESVTLLAYERYTQKHLSGLDKKAPLKALLKIWSVFFDFVENETDLYSVILMAHIDKKIPDAGVALFKSTIDIFSRADKIRKLTVTPEVAAQIYYSAAQGSALLYLSQSRNVRFRKGIKIARDMCLRGLLG